MPNLKTKTMAKKQERAVLIYQKNPKNLEAEVMKQEEPTLMEKIKGAFHSTKFRMKERKQRRL